MALKVVQDFIVPAREGRAVEVKKGQTLRIYLLEAPQVADVVFFNSHNYKEQFHVGQTWAFNTFLGTGNARSFKYFFSKPPWENIMLTVVKDTVKNHFGNMSGRCSVRMNEIRHIVRPRSCQENLAEALAPYGIKGEDINDCFNVFMDVELNGDGAFVIRAPTLEAGDYVDLLAEMDILAAVSACPSDTSPSNGGKPKPLGIQVFA